MKKEVLLFACMLAVCATLQAFGQATGLVNTQEKAYSAQVEAIAISSNTAHDVSSHTASGTISDAWGVEVYNLSTSTSAVCAFRTDVSRDLNSAEAGRVVPAGVGVYWGVRNTNETLYCISSNGLLRLIISQFK